MDCINSRIHSEICYDTIDMLKDDNLLEEYKECKSVKNEIHKMSSILDKHVGESTKRQIIKEYIFDLIPAGTKGVIRGNKFNEIVRKAITDMNLDSKRFKVCFEKKFDRYFTSEIPDWFIFDKLNDKIIIGMNQLDLWKGGHQINRGSKYIFNNEHNTATSKLLCVICNEIEFKTNNSKTYKLFETGFNNNTLCYLNNLGHIIHSYFS